MGINDIKMELRKAAMEKYYIYNIKKEINNIIKELEIYSNKLCDANDLVKDAYLVRCNSLNKLLKRRESYIETLEIANELLYEDVSKLDCPQKLILECHYFQGMTYEEISHKLNYSIARIYQHHKRGLEQLLAIKEKELILTK